MYADLHIHTAFSCDSDADMEQCVSHAIDKKMQMICFTDHVDLNPHDYGYLYYKPEAFLEKYHELQNKYGHLIRICAGIEFGEPHLYPEQLRELSTLPYDFIIGSIHWIKDMFPDEKTRAQYSAKEFFSIYWDEMLQTVKHGGFDALGHVDFPKRYYGELYYSENQVREIYKHLLDQDMVIEINTSSLRKGLAETMPGRELLEIYKNCGGRYVTIGSDAHEVTDIGADNEIAQTLIRDFGLQEVVFAQRKRMLCLPTHCFCDQNYFVI